MELAHLQPPTGLSDTRRKLSLEVKPVGVLLPGAHEAGRRKDPLSTAALSPPTLAAWVGPRPRRGLMALILGSLHRRDRARSRPRPRPVPRSRGAGAQGSASHRCVARGDAGLRGKSPGLAVWGPTPAPRPLLLEPGAGRGAPTDQRGVATSVTRPHAAPGNPGPRQPPSRPVKTPLTAKSQTRWPRSSACRSVLFSFLRILFYFPMSPAHKSTVVRALRD